MAPPITFFLSIGESPGLGLGTEGQQGQSNLWKSGLFSFSDTLPRPTLWALPSPVVYNGTNVTFRCQGPLRSGRFQLWKDGELRDERNASRELAEFELRNVNGMTDARNYSCRYGQGPLWSDFSEPLALVVTGFFPQPQISTHIHLQVNPGRQVTILCKKLPSIFSQDYIFVLLEAESLKPLKKKSPTENTVFFTFPSVRIQDSGNYSCIYYKKTAPYIGSKPSQALKLTVLGKLPKPTLWTQSGLVVIPGTNITFWCSRPKLSFLKEVTFTLWRPWTGKYLNEQSSGELWTSFLLPSVRPGDTGSYRCTYKEMTASARNSENSDDLKLLVTGSLPKPTLSALPGLVVEPGTHVTLQCEHPPSYSSLWGVTFILLKVGISQPLQRQSPGGTSADFLLLSVRAQDAGSYSCVYHEEMMTLSQVSEPSEVLEIWVTDALPKASLSVRPVPEIASGVNVTLLCQGPSRGTGIVLYKEGGKQILPSMYTTQDGAQFSLTHVTPKHSGNYSCGYQPGTEGSLWTQLSDPLELIVRDHLPKPTLWADPSPVVAKGANVTLQCQGRLGSDIYQLWKDEELQDERKASRKLTEFMLRNVDDVIDARDYSCRYRHGHSWSELSDPLALVVLTEELPKPSISSPDGSTESPGETATIYCQMSEMTPSHDYSFALLEAKSLEPLQRKSLAGTKAAFSLPALKKENSGEYSCIYYKRTTPYRGSQPSQTRELRVLGLFPKPILWVQSGLIVFPGTNISFWCSRPKLYSLEKVIFTLWKVETQKSLQEHISVEPWTRFVLSSVEPKDTGSYSCTYRHLTDSDKGSESSDALKLIVTGSLPKPSLFAFPDLVVKPGVHVTLQCRQPLQSPLWGVTFALLKVGAPQPLQSQSPTGTSADFLLLSVRAQDAGNYSCIYSSRTVPYQVSEPSEVLEIWVTDTLYKASLSVWPDSEVESGTNVTFLCRGPSWSTRFVLYKEREEKILLTMDTTQDGAQWFLIQVTPQNSGNYRCSYQSGTNESLWEQSSDPLELTVRASVPSTTLIITLSCVSFFIFFLLLLAFLCHRSISMDTEVAKGRPRESLVPMTEDLQGVTYTQLNIGALNKRHKDTKKTPSETIVYATVSLD
ncbi:immunoglobulin superfamily member 1-like [Monodelphis domestica]|uniref:immunoglobulin superfamily member 1-like n=1 Tax=Monodelphis domestica TaxID=13616 RepID=UPI0024E21376|nr:immunoglobulin superfamily member 1-like [Monodelphis domestica]